MVYDLIIFILKVATLRERADHVSRLLDAQVEEFRRVFGAVARENDHELERLAAENDRLKSALANQGLF